MKKFQQRLEDVLKEGLDCEHIDLETLSNGHVCGHVVSKKFGRLDFAGRRKRIRSVLDQAAEEGTLQADELLRVSTLLTYTPNEWRVASTNPSATLED